MILVLQMARFVLESNPEQKFTILNNTGFSDIEFRDDSKPFLGYANAILKNLTKHSKFIEQRYDQELFSIIWKEYEELIKKISQNDKFAIRIVSRKKILI